VPVWHARGFAWACERADMWHAPCNARDSVLSTMKGVPDFGLAA